MYFADDLTEVTPYSGFGLLTGGEISLRAGVYGKYKNFGVFGQGEDTCASGANCGYVISDTVSASTSCVENTRYMLLSVYPLSSSTFTQLTQF